MKLVARQVVKCEAIAGWKMMGRVKKGKGWTGRQRGRRGNIARQGRGGNRGGRSRAGTINRR